MPDYVRYAELGGLLDGLGNEIDEQMGCGDGAVDVANGVQVRGCARSAGIRRWT